MAFIPVPHCARVAFLHSIPVTGRVFSNIVHFTKTGYSLEDQENLGDAIDGAWALFVIAFMSELVTFTGVQVTDIRTLDGPVVNIPSGVSGSLLDQIAPLQTACVVTLRTSARGRSGRGRGYIGGFTEAGIESGAFTAQVTAAVQAVYDDIQDLAAAVGWTMVVVSRQQDKVILEEGVTRSVTAIEVRSALPGSQRRRTGRP